MVIPEPPCDPTNGLRDPPRIHDVKVTDQQGDDVLGPVDEGATVHVICEWEDGNPPVTVHLLERHRLEIGKARYKDGQSFRHTIPTVPCQISGTIYCEAPAATENKTTTLLVRCPPELGPRNLPPLPVVSGQQATLVFSLRTHTPEVQDCWLNRVSLNDVTEMPDDGGAANGTEVNCSSSFTVTGTPPDLVLTVRLDNVMKQDEGQWTLTLSNDVGPGHLEFNVKVIGDGDSEPAATQSDSQAHTTNTSTKNLDEQKDIDSTSDLTQSQIHDRRVVIIVGANIVGVLILVVVIITLHVKRGRRGRRSVDEDLAYVEMLPAPPHPQPPQAGAADEDNASHRSSSQNSTHTYEEVRDREDSDCSLPLPVPCRRKVVEPDDYLHPVASQTDNNDKNKDNEESDVTSKQEESAETPPVYENRKEIVEASGASTLVESSV